MTQLFVNNATSTLNGSITNIQTTIAVQSADAAKFPSPSGGNYFLVTVVDGAGNLEIMKCTSRASATLTVVRAQEGTTGFAFASGARVDARLTAASIANFLQFTGPNIINDDQLVVADPVDTTKRGRLDAGLVTPGQTRIWSGPDSDGNLIINLGSFQLKQSAGPTPTAEGDIQWHTTENSIYVGDGAGQAVFRPNMWETIYNNSFAGVAQVDFINLSAFRFLRMDFSLAVATDNADPLLRVSTDNGSTFLAGATEYNNFRIFGNAAAVNFSSSSITGFPLDGFQGVDNTAATAGIHGFAELFEFNQAAAARFHGMAWMRKGSDSTGMLVQTGGDGTSTAAKNALRLIASAGNISGRVALIGMRG